MLHLRIKKLKSNTKSEKLTRFALFHCEESMSSRNFSVATKMTQWWGDVWSKFSDILYTTSRYVSIVLALLPWSQMDTMHDEMTGRVMSVLEPTSSYEYVLAEKDWWKSQLQSVESPVFFSSHIRIINLLESKEFDEISPKEMKSGLFSLMRWIMKDIRKSQKRVENQQLCMTFHSLMLAHYHELQAQLPSGYLDDIIHSLDLLIQSLSGDRLDLWYQQLEDLAYRETISEKYDFYVYFMIWAYQQDWSLTAWKSELANLLVNIKHHEKMVPLMITME